MGRAREGLGVEEECPSESAIVREEYYRAMKHFWHQVQNCYWEFEDVVSEFMDLVFGFIGGAIVATGVVLAKHFFLPSSSTFQPMSHAFLSILSIWHPINTSILMIFLPFLN